MSSELYINQLHEQLKHLKEKQLSIETRVQQTQTHNPDFWNLISERNNTSVDIAIIKSRIENYNKPGIVPTIEIIQ